MFLSTAHWDQTWVTLVTLVAPNLKGHFGCAAPQGLHWTGGALGPTLRPGCVVFWFWNLTPRCAPWICQHTIWRQVWSHWAKEHVWKPEKKTWCCALGPLCCETWKWSKTASKSVYSLTSEFRAKSFSTFSRFETRIFVAALNCWAHLHTAAPLIVIEIRFCFRASWLRRIILTSSRIQPHLTASHWLTLPTFDSMLGMSRKDVLDGSGIHQYPLQAACQKADIGNAQGPRDGGWWWDWFTDGARQESCMWPTPPTLRIMCIMVDIGPLGLIRIQSKFHLI